MGNSKKKLQEYVCVFIVILNMTSLTQQYGPFIGATFHGGNTLENKLNTSLAESSPTARSCLIIIRNYHKNIVLVEPKYFVERGHPHLTHDTYSVIKPGDKEEWMFRKAHGVATGSYGVLTYKINQRKSVDDEITENDGSTLAIMWGVPWEWRWYSNWQAVGIWNNNPEPNYDLFRQMYYEEGNFVRKEAGQSIAYEKIIYGNIKVKITTTMDDESRATLTINIM